MFTLPIDMTYDWLAPLSVPSHCRVRIDLHPTLGLVCLMSERHDNPGLSITNGIESLIETFEGVLCWERTMWIEHYPEGLARDEHFDRVFYTPGQPGRRIYRAGSNNQPGGAGYLRSLGGSTDAFGFFIPSGNVHALQIVFVRSPEPNLDSEWVDFIPSPRSAAALGMPVRVRFQT